MNKDGLKIVLPFNGMGCGAIAIKQLGWKIDRLVISEIDKYANQTMMHNFPESEQVGDAFTADFTPYKGFDIVAGGSPCTYWSIAQSPDRRETTSSGMGWDLFQQFVRCVKEVEPEFFIYENNKSMSKEIKKCIDDTFGFEPVMINSALVSAQNRQRYYWVGRRVGDHYERVDVPQPDDRGILLRDVLDSAVALQDKAHAAIASQSRTTEREYFVKNQGNMCAEPVCCRYVRTEEGKQLRKAYESGEIHHGFNEHRVIEPREDGKSNAVTTVGKDNPIMESVGNPLSEAEMNYLVQTETGRYNGRQNFMQKPGEDDKSGTIVANVHKGVPYNVCAELIPVNTTEDGKAGAVRATCYKDTDRNLVGNDTDRRTAVAIPVNTTDTGKSQTVKAQCEKTSTANILGYSSTYGASGVAEQVGALPRPNGELSTSQAFRVYSVDGKGVTLKANGGGSGAKTGLYAIRSDGKEFPVYEVKDGMITVKEKQYPIKLKDGLYIIRKLSVTECMRLQTIPEWFEFPVSNSQAYKQIGNGWTVEVIMHLLRCCDDSVSTPAKSVIEDPEGWLQFVLEGF